MTTPTRAEMCADLARAMFPTAVIEPSLSGSSVDIRIYFDPFTNAADNRAMVEWLAEQEDVVRNAFEHELESKIAPYGGFGVLSCLTASLETIAEAAWRAIQSEASDDKSSQSKAHVQPCPCAWCRVDRGNAADIVRAAMEKLGTAEKD